MGSRVTTEHLKPRLPTEEGGEIPTTAEVPFRIISVLILVMVSLLVAVVALALHRDKDTITEAALCTSPSCTKISESITEETNLSADPCKDMYEYACGRWLNAHRPSPDKPSRTRFSELQGTVNEDIKQLIESEGYRLKGVKSTAIVKWKTLYKTCMDETTLEKLGIKPLRQLMNNLGSWTATPQGIRPWNKSSWSIQQSVMDMHSLGVHSLFSYDIYKDVKNSSRQMIYFKQSDFPLSNRQEHASSPDYKNAYLAMAVKIGSLLGGHETTVRDKMTKVFLLEQKLAAISWRGENTADFPARFNRMTLAKFQTLLGPWIDITAYLKRIFQGISFTDTTEIVVNQPVYFRKLRSLIAHTDNEDLANYMMWTAILSLTNYLPTAFAEAVFEVTRVETGKTTLPPRWERCLAMSQRYLGSAGGALLVQEKFSPESKAKVRTILEEIRAQFTANLEEVAWLDKVTVDNLREKAKYMTMIVGYPDWILNPALLDRRYTKLEIMAGEMFRNGLMIFSYLKSRKVDKYLKKQDSDAWPHLPTVVRVFYTRPGNAVVIPAAILQPPFFSPDYPDPLIYGALGTLLGQELTRGFDDIGRHFDKFGNVGEMWTTSAVKRFKGRALCMEQQSNSYTVEEDLHMNLRRTLDENIAVAGGVKLAFRAWKNSSRGTSVSLPGLPLTPEQMFFLGFSQNWCMVSTPAFERNSVLGMQYALGKFRVTGALANNEDFAKAYRCGPDSPLNPRKKCQIW